MASDPNNNIEDELVDYNDDNDDVDNEQNDKTEQNDKVKGSYAAITSSSFKDFMLKKN